MKLFVGKKLLMLVLVAMVCILFVGCGGGSDTGSDSGEVTAKSNAAGDPNVLTLVVSSDPTTMDPAMNSYFAPHQVSRHIYEPLFTLDKEYDVKGLLVDKWEYKDDATIQMHLIEGIVMQNGETLKSEDVLFSLKRCKDDKTAGGFCVSKIDFDNCNAIDDYNFVIKTYEPSSNQLHLLSTAFCGIYSKSDYETKGGDFFKGIAGTGPYTLDSYTADDKYTLAKYDKYWNDSSEMIGKIVFRVITEGANRAIEAETGGADIVYDVVANDKDRITENKNLQYISSISFNNTYIFLNMSKKPLDDIRVRQAIWYGLDRALVEKIAYKNMGALASGLLVDGVSGKADVSKYFVERDVDKAKALLAEAGYADGLTIEFAAESNQQMRMDVAEAVQAQLAEIGITVELKFMDANAYATYVCGGSAQMCVYGYYTSTGEAGHCMLKFTPAASQYAACSHGSQEIIDLVNDGLRTIDQTERNAIYAQAQEKIMETRSAIPLWSKEINAAVANYVEGFELDKTYETHLLTNVRFNLE